MASSSSSVERLRKLMIYLNLWDAESVKIPRDFDPRLVMPSLKLFHSRYGMTGTFTEAVVAKMANDRISLFFIHWLCQGELDLTSLDVGGKDVADEEIRRRMGKWGEIPEHKTLTLMTGDGGFAEYIEDLNTSCELIVHFICQPPN